MPHFNHMMPVLKTRDMQATIDFYTRTLGFTLLWRSPNDGGGENCMLSAGDASLMFSTGDHLGETPQLSGTLYFNLNGVDAYYEEVKPRAELVWPLEEMEYGTREFGIKDCNGYTLAFSEDLSP
jgi:catechol 2,3-dioxygenase-like lactoylglutathione lyase family enzyme